MRSVVMFVTAACVPFLIILQLLSKELVRIKLAPYEDNKTILHFSLFFTAMKVKWESFYSGSQIGYFAKTLTETFYNHLLDS